IFPHYVSFWRVIRRNSAESKRCRYSAQVLFSSSGRFSAEFVRSSSFLTSRGGLLLGLPTPWATQHHYGIPDSRWSYSLEWRFCHVRNCDSDCPQIPSGGVERQGERLCKSRA